MMVNGLNGPASTAWDMQDRIGMAMAGQTEPVLARRAPGNANLDPGGGAP